MEWTDSGIILGHTPFGENAYILSIFTEQRGHAKGLFRPNKTTRGWAEVGTVVSCAWNARLPEHLGNYTLEEGHVYAASLLSEPARLHALLSICNLLRLTLPEHQVSPVLYEATLHTIQQLTTDAWLKNYVLWEKILLEELGFGMDLTACAATGLTENLQYVSPKTGRAVSARAGLPYHEKLLTLPAFFLDALNYAALSDIRQGLKITGYFLEKWVLSLHQQQMPTVRRMMGDISA
jgi:DNA repair protein RecO (recombination protein O)